MSTTIVRPTATIAVDVDEFALEPGSRLTLDVGAVRYGDASAVLPLVEDSILEWIDEALENGDRLPITADFGSGPRVFDLGLRSRVVDHVAKTVTLDLSTDEALLQEYSVIAEDKGARTHQASLRAVVNYVLGKIGATLEPGTTDANVTAYWSVQNMVQNPSMQVDISGWQVGTGAGSMSRSAVGVTPVAGTHALFWLTTIVGESNVLPLATSSTYGVTPGKSYVWSYYQYSGTNTTARAVIRWYTSGNIYIGSTFGTAGTSVPSAFTRFSVIAKAPDGAAYASPYVNTTGNAVGWGHLVDGAMFYEGDEVVPYFDGSTTDTSTYTYDWQGDANASPSTRTPVNERLPELFTWEPGVKAWEFLVPITGSENVVLWCDEQRRWFLDAPENRTIPDLVTVTTSNTRVGEDELSRDSNETFLDGIVIRYRDDMIDAAGVAGKVRTVDLDRAYPGPGLAAAMLGRSLGTGRVQTATIVRGLTATPGMQASFSLPGAPDTLGRVAAVEFLLAEGFTSITAAGLIDIIPGSIAALVGTIDSLVGTIDSL